MAVSIDILFSSARLVSLNNIVSNASICVVVHSDIFFPVPSILSYIVTALDSKSFSLVDFSSKILDKFGQFLNIGADTLGTYTVCGEEQWGWVAFAFMTSLILVLLSFAMLFVGGALLAAFVVNRIISAIAIALLNYMLSTIKTDAITGIRKQCEA